MMIALILKKRDDLDRQIYLYDTFEGMSSPTIVDQTAFGENAAELLEKHGKLSKRSIWFDSSLEEVKENMRLTFYPEDKMAFVKGKVEDTLASNVPIVIALLRLDTDWYESTKVELEILYPLLKPKGVLIIDDFGHWEGAKKAVLKYFNGAAPLLHRIDNTGRIMVKE